MRRVTFDELLSLSAYEQIRDRFRKRIIEHKRNRRVFIGPEMTLVFEDHDTVLHQVQEMLRAERITSARAIREELDVYNELIPPAGCLRGTLMIEIEDATLREARRREYVGLDDHVHFVLGPHRIAASFDPEGRFEDRISVVRYVTFALPNDGSSLLCDLNVPAKIVVSHPRYQHTVDLSEITRRTIADDLLEDTSA